MIVIDGMLILKHASEAERLQAEALADVFRKVQNLEVMVVSKDVKFKTIGPDEIQDIMDRRTREA